MNEAANTTAASAVYPISFESAAPAAYMRDPAIARLVEFFRAKGLAALKQEDRDETWCQDWIEYQAQHGLYAGLLSLERHSSRGHRFEIRKLTRFLEVISYFSPAHAYSLHVSFLGIFPLLMSENAALQHEAIARLEQGGLFAFGVSERAHGSDLFANEFTVKAAGDSRWLAEGEKYYIGNANEACMISILARIESESAGSARRLPFMMIALRPATSPAFGGLRKIRTLGIRAAFVGEFQVRGHELPASDVIAEGRRAWDAVFATVDFGKFFLGFGAIGICEHAMAEASAHLHARVLYGRPAAEIPHIRATTAVAFARLVAMKFFATRALDYLQAACASERRYLLFCAVQKARVSTEGVKVLGLLSECIGARGVESETYFEQALRDAQLIPGLEGSTHINFGITAKFIGPYFANADEQRQSVAPAIEFAAGDGENPYWMLGGNRNPANVVFDHALRAYEPWRQLANVTCFVRQIESFRAHVHECDRSGEPSVTGDEVTLAQGRCFAIIAYAQLVAETCTALAAAPALVAVIFHTLVEDLGVETLRLRAILQTHGLNADRLRDAALAPATSAADLCAVGQMFVERFVTGIEHDQAQA